MKKILIFIWILSLSLTTGCWDMKEINERIFPYSAGIDLVDKDDYNEGRYEISFTYPNINALGSQATQDEIVYLTSTRANNIFDAASQIASKIQKPMYLRDLKVVVIPEKLAREKDLMEEIVDGLNRDYIINKKIYFLVVETSAKDLLGVKVESKRQAEVEGLLYGLLRNDQGSTKFINKDLNTFVENMDTCKASVMPKARVEGEDIIIDSSAVFKDYQLIGYLDEEDNKNISILTNLLKNFGLNLEYNGGNLALNAPRPRTKMKLIKTDKGFKVLNTVKIEAQVEQFTIDEESKLNKEKELKEMERTVENLVKTSIGKTIKKLQKDLNTDLIGIGDHMYKFHPKIWRGIKDDFDYIFPDIKIETQVNVDIRRRGLTK